MVMSPKQKFIVKTPEFKKMLLDYMEIRKVFQKLGFSESDLSNVPYYTHEMMSLYERIGNSKNSLFKKIKDYGFDIDKREVLDFIQKFFMRINELTPLKDVSDQRNNSWDQDYQ